MALTKPGKNILGADIDADTLDGLDSLSVLSTRKNYIINGNFDIWQRGNSFSFTGHTADRWIADISSVGAVGSVARLSFTLGQTAVPNEPKFAVRHNRTTASTVGTIILGQRIEGVRTLAGKKVTVSFYARDNNGASTQRIDFVQVFGTGGSPSASVALPQLDINLTTDWQKFTFTFDIPSIAGKTLGTNGDDYLYFRILNPAAILGLFNIDIAQIQIEEGSVATNFEYRNIVDELALCQRYYQSYGLSTTVGKSNASSQFDSILFPVKMRAMPTSTLSSIINNDGATDTVSSIACSDSGYKIITFTGMGVTNGDRFTFTLAVDAEL